MAGFLEPRHEGLRRELRAKFANLQPDETDAEGTALAKLVRALDIYRYLLPTEFGGFGERPDVRTLCVIRDELAYRHPAADSVFAVQGLGSFPIFLAGDTP